MLQPFEILRNIVDTDMINKKGQTNSINKK